MKIRLSNILAAALLAGASALPFQASAEPYSKYWEQRASLFSVLPVDSDDIIFLGNSITDGGEFFELVGNPNVKNRGISGDIIPGVRDRLRDVTKGHPAKIFLLIGINDISHGAPVDSIAADYAALVKDIREQSPETKLYIQSVFPVDNKFGLYRNMIGRDHLVPVLNEKIKKIADDNGLTYIDFWPLLFDPETKALKREFTNDGLHLLGNAYVEWVNLVSPYINE